MTYLESTGYGSAYISNGYNRDARLRAVATNALREAVIAFGRVDRPYTDNDAAILENIYCLLQGVGEETRVSRENEHQTLSVTNTTPAPAQSKIADLLEHSDSLEPAVKVNLPKSTQKPDR